MDGSLFIFAYELPVTLDIGSEDGRELTFKVMGCQADTSSEYQRGQADKTSELEHDENSSVLEMWSPEQPWEKETRTRFRLCE